MNEKDKRTIRELINLRNEINTRIDNELSENILRDRPDSDGLCESIKYKLDEFSYRMKQLK